MKLAVISHKVCWPCKDAPELYQTDGGFPLQINAISELFEETKLIVPCETSSNCEGVTRLTGRNLRVVSLSVPKGSDLRRKLNFPLWLVINGGKIWREIKKADAVHAPVPGDVGTIGMLFALLLRKRLFVRYCGNWHVRRTVAESFWQWVMEFFAGGRNVMLATGGGNADPSSKNPNIKWIFSTSLTECEIAQGAAHEPPTPANLRLIIACRQERGKGTDIVLESLRILHSKFPGATLHVVGDGSFLDDLKSMARTLNLENKVTFHGKLEPKQVLDALREAHIFCYPTESEGFPKVVVEALASGLPVVTTAVSVLPALINNDCGVLIGRATAGDVACAVESILRTPNNYRRLSEGAVATAREYSLERWREGIDQTLRRAWKVNSLSAPGERSRAS